MENLPDNICEECEQEDESVKPNLIIIGYKICELFSKNNFAIIDEIKKV